MTPTELTINFSQKNFNNSNEGDLIYEYVDQFNNNDTLKR